MHQLTCGVDHSVWIDGYRVQVIEVNGDVVKFGLSLPNGTTQRHEVRLPAVESESRRDDDPLPSYSSLIN